MKTGELAKYLGISDETLRNWTVQDELSTYLSDDARGVSASAQRYFAQSDIEVLITVATLRNRDNVTDWMQIEQFLKSGKRYTDFPAAHLSFDSRTVSMTQAEHSAKAMATLSERDAALKRVDELQTQIANLQKAHREEVDRLRQELKDQRKEHREEMREVDREYRDEMNKLHEKIAELNRELGRLESDD